MNTNALLPLAAATLFALCAGSMVLSQHHDESQTPAPVAVAANVIDLPAVNVRPDPADLAYFQATQSARVVDLPAVKVTPDMADLAYYQAARGAERVVTLAAVTVRPAASDLAWYVSHQAGQVASIEATAIRQSAQQMDAQIAAGAVNLVRAAR